MAVMIGGLTVVSSAVFGGNVVGHMGYIGAGIIAWSAMSAMITEGPSAFVRYGSLITSTNIDVECLRWPHGVQDPDHICAPSYYLCHWSRISGCSARLDQLLGNPWNCSCSFANGFWVVTALAFICARFRDVQLIVRNLLQLAFFVTPVFWHYHIVAANRQYICGFQHSFSFLQIVRAPLLGHFPSARIILLWRSVTEFGSALAHSCPTPNAARTRFFRLNPQAMSRHDLRPLDQGQC